LPTMPHQLTIHPGTTLDLRIAVGVGPIVDTIGGSLSSDGCLAPGNAVIVCSCDTACNPLKPGQCFTVGPNSVVSPQLPAGKSKLIKAADLRGFAVVLRLGSGAERYLSTGAACKDSDRAVIAGCHAVEPGDLLTLPGAVDSVVIKAALDGESEGKRYTVIVMAESAKADVSLAAGTIASVQEPQMIYTSRVNQCGIMSLQVPPSETRCLPVGRMLPFTLSLERSWDYTAFNRVHETDCEPAPSWSNLITSGMARVG
jgi:hypothetical protein